MCAAIRELIDGLHQADIALLNQVEELQPTIGVFLGDRDDEAQVRLHQLLLGLTRLALALLHHLHDLAELADLEPGLTSEHLDLVCRLLLEKKMAACIAYGSPASSTRAAFYTISPAASGSVADCASW